MGRYKIKAIIAKCYRNRGRISLSNRKKENYEDNIENNTDLDKVNDKHPL